MVTKQASTTEVELDKGGKYLHIYLYNGQPTFDFSSGWTGKDITLISGLIAREYRKYVHDLRLEGRLNVKKESKI